ncbi:MAG: hypothetical protein ACRDVZ_09120 [Jiangellaceae bacterium]
MNSEMQGVRAGLQTLDQGVSSGAVGRGRLWGGAGVRIVRAAPEPSAGSGFPDPRTVVTRFAYELSWLFSELWTAFQPVLDYASKIEFFGRLANAADRYQAKAVDGENVRDLLGAVLHEAYAIADELEEGSFGYLVVAPAGAVYDDFIDEAEREGYMTVEETRRWFAE